jgi:hypothetical protein
MVDVCDFPDMLVRFSVPGMARISGDTDVVILVNKCCPVRDGKAREALVRLERGLVRRLGGRP